VLSSILGSEITVSTFLICSAVSIVLGIGTALLFGYKSKASKSFIITLALLPLVVQTVIMLVNGNLGAGVAVAGAFGLVRFRSAPGTAKEIAMLFLAMALGLATGLGYVALAAVFFGVTALFTLALGAAGLGAQAAGERELRITIPEDLDYEGLFDDLLEQYAKAWQLERVKTSHMGTLYELQYRVTLRGEQVPKAFLDELRTRNGNLNIVCGRIEQKETL
jgi:hypothetical protein